MAADSMNDSRGHEVTTLLRSWRQGDDGALDQLVPLVHAELRRVARSLYEETRALPLICPHGHVDPRLLAEDAPFPEPAALLITPNAVATKDD